ncbi:MAG: hypothetical protein ABJA62_02765 [Luteimonas sp.]
MEHSISTDRARSGPFAWLIDNLSVGVSATRGIGLGHALLAAVMIALGIRGLVYGDFASVWQRIPIENLPGQTFFAYACALIELLAGIGLLIRRTSALASCALFVFLVLWVVLLKVPPVVAMPQMEATWLGVGEISVILAGGWTVFAMHAGAKAKRHLGFAVGMRGVRWARLLFALALPMIGLAHFVYAKQTADFMPKWMPAPYFWVYLTGSGSIAASLGVLFAFYPRLAATLEAAMLSIITILVWLPGLIAAPSNGAWTPFLMSTAIACGAWAVADAYRGLPWFGVGASQHA